MSFYFTCSFGQKLTLPTEKIKLKLLACMKLSCINTKVAFSQKLVVFGDEVYISLS